VSPAPVRGAPVSIQGPPPDAEARERIRSALDVNLLVEAGAGSGKTTSLVDRLMAYVARGEAVDRLAAVTFTRKAAGELRERFQLALEKAAREARDRATGGDTAAPAEAERYEQALTGLDGAFLGTIHAFCARLLRERPIAAGIDPSFEEVTEAAWDQLRADFWRRFLEGRVLAADPMVARLLELGVQPTTLGQAFAERIKHPDVDFSSPQTPVPDVAAVRTRLEKLLDRSDAFLPHEEPEDGWDPLQLTCRALGFSRRAAEWAQPPGFLRELGDLTKSNLGITQKRWSADKDVKAAVKVLAADFLDLLEGPGADLLTQWREHRYPAVLRFLDAAMRDFERERLTSGKLGFEDLLLRSRDLLKNDRGARRELGERYAHLLVDEFQDTDPIQAEICFLLASDPASGDDWRAVALRGGALFVVGDPKQSIYRFRRASFDTYRMVKERFAQCGDVLQLTASFRCAPEIAGFVDAHFRRTFPAADSEEQAAFAPMQPWGAAASAAGRVCYYAFEADAKASRVPELREDAQLLASWIAERMQAGAPAESFLVLTPQVADTTEIVRELGARNVPVSLTGGRFQERDEVAELLVILRALADPDNPVLVAAALESWCFGLSPLDLLEGRDAGLVIGISHPPASDATAAGRALRTLHEWWTRAHAWPLEEVVERILDETGLLALAAASDLGESRAGSLVKLVAALRETSGAASGISGLVETVQDMLAHAEGGAQLRPERRDAVRVMNLHKAKGLEADIVVLAAPADTAEHEPAAHVARSGDAGARSGMLIQDGDDLVAQPPDWAALADREARFQDAERERLLYVAATRAKRELVVARLERRATKAGEARESKALWKPFDVALLGDGAKLACAIAAAPGRQRLSDAADELQARIGAVAARRSAAGRATIGTTSVTRSAKEEQTERRAADADWSASSQGPPVRGRGRAWGSAVHRVIEGLGRGRRGADLLAFARAVAVDERPARTAGAAAADAADPDASAAELAAVAERAWESATAQGPGTAGARFVEWPLAVAETAADGVQRVTEGVVDMAAFDGVSWHVLDWKTEVDDAAWDARVEAYQAQVGRYAAIISRLRGEPVAGRLVRIPPPSAPAPGQERSE
jgi:ATP-dependent helicase/nuclease subunit A